MPIDAGHSAFMVCCGKEICNGCIIAMFESEGKDLCAFCRTPPSNSDNEIVRGLKKLMDDGNAHGFYLLAGHYYDGTMGMPQDYQKANELYLKAGELGCARGYFNLGQVYDSGTGVEVDKKKAKYYFELAAMDGDITGRNNLGCMEYEAGNHYRAFKHLIIAAKAGLEESLDAVKQGFMAGYITKDGYASTLRAYHERRKETKSGARAKAEALG